MRKRKGVRLNAVLDEVQRLTRLINTAQMRIAVLLQRLNPQQRVRVPQKPRSLRDSKAKQKPQKQSKPAAEVVEPLKAARGTCTVAWRNRTKWTKAPIRCLVRTKDVARGHYLLGWLQEGRVTYLRLSGRLVVPLSRVKKASCGGVTLTSHKSLLAILTGKKQFVPRPHAGKTRVQKPKVAPECPKTGKAAAEVKAKTSAQWVAPVITGVPPPAEFRKLGVGRAYEDRSGAVYFPSACYAAGCTWQGWVLDGYSAPCPKCKYNAGAFMPRDYEG